MDIFYVETETNEKGSRVMGDTVLRNEIRTAKKWYYCAWCDCIIFPGMKYQYLYGGKETFGKMTVLRYCMKCAKNHSNNN